MSSTSNYGMFKNIEGNRPVEPRHVKVLVEEIEKKNLLAEFPILVNEKFEIIDGQHRLMAAASLGVPVFYTIVKGLELPHVMSINTAQRSWSLWDFVNSYAELGKRSYKQLAEFAEKNGLGVSMAARLLNGRSVISNTGGGTKLIRNGTFEVSTPSMAQRVVNALVAIAPYADFNVKSDRNLVQVMWLLMLDEDFDINRLVGKFKTHGRRLHKQLRPRQYLLALEEVYNFNAKDVVTLYKGQV